VRILTPNAADKFVLAGSFYVRMRLLLADDHTPFRRGLRQMLEDYGFFVVGEAPNGSSAVRLARELRPDVTVMDLSMPGMGGAQATQAILDEDPGARVLVLTISAEHEEVLDALLAGACGYLLKDAEAAEIVAGVRAAAVGDVMISPTVATRLVARVREERRSERVMAPPKPPPLTARERDILRLLAQGRENSAIAVELVISPATVKTHVAHLLDKLNLDNRVQAAVFAVRHGIS
jgi:two-component system nitrate/nitrite response regulator NarL